MKRIKYVIFILILLFTSVCNGFVTDTGVDWRLTGTVLKDCTLSGTTASTLAAVMYRDALWLYVDSAAVGGADGSSWDDAYTTLDAAVNACVGATEYVILVNAGHNEALVAADDVDIDVARVTVIGMGIGSAIPRFDYDTGVDGEFVIGAANVKIVNLAFLPSIAVITHAIDIENNGDYAQIIDCVFLEGESAGTDEFIDPIVVGTTATNVVISGCTYFGTGTGANTFVNLDAAAIANVTIKNCTIFGEFLEAPIWWAAAVPTNVLFANNSITNLTTGQACIEGSGNATGVIKDNDLHGDTYGAILLSGNTRVSNNKQTIGIDQGAVDVPLVAGRVYSISTSVDEVTADLFDVDGGSILILNLTGVVDVAIGGNATNCKILINRDDSSADTDFTTAVTITSDVIGNVYVFSNANPAVLTPLVPGSNGSTTLMTSWYCPEGMIEQNMSADPGGDAGDHITWSLTFIPLENGISVIPQG